MKRREIDYNKCIGCKKCLVDCVNKYIVDIDSDGNSVDKPMFKEHGVCINCGHCEAICPMQAITEIDNNNDIDMTEDTILKLMSSKRTVRRYIKEKNIEKEIIDRIIYAGQTAPTDRNRKTGKIVMIKDILPIIYREAVNWLWETVRKDGTINPLFTSVKNMKNNIDEILWNAEYLVIIIGNKQYGIDAAISAERMQLEAESLGVSTAYRGDMKQAINALDSLKTMLSIRSNEEVLVAFAMGYSNVKYHRPSVKKNRKVYFV